MKNIGALTATRNSKSGFPFGNLPLKKSMVAKIAFQGNNIPKPNMRKVILELVDSKNFDISSFDLLDLILSSCSKATSSFSGSYIVNIASIGL